MRVERGKGEDWATMHPTKATRWHVKIAHEGGHDDMD